MNLTNVDRGRYVGEPLMLVQTMTYGSYPVASGKIGLAAVNVTATTEGAAAAAASLSGGGGGGGVQLDEVKAWKMSL
jgi:hypothetical protein